MADPAERDFMFILKRLIPLKKGPEPQLSLFVNDIVIFTDGVPSHFFIGNHRKPFQMISSPHLRKVSKFFMEARKTSIEEGTREQRNLERFHWKLIEGRRDKDEIRCIQKPEFVDICSYVEDNPYWKSVLFWKFGTCNEKFEFIYYRYKFVKGSLG